MSISAELCLNNVILQIEKKKKDMIGESPVDSEVF